MGAQGREGVPGLGRNGQGRPRHLGRAPRPPAASSATGGAFLGRDPGRVEIGVEIGLRLVVYRHGVRRAGTPLEHDRAPWADLGVSRATWYRRFRGAKADGESLGRKVRLKANTDRSPSGHLFLKA